MKLQNYEMQLIKRSQINPAPYNPRIIEEGARKRLKKKMKQVGLLSPLIWNKRSGNLVSGHQRLSVLDELEKYKPGENDYDINVAACDLDDKTEKEMVVFLNNPSSQGDWDLGMLADLNLSSSIDFNDMGFIPADIDILFEGDSRFSEIFHDDGDVTAAKDTIGKIKDVRKKATAEFKDENRNDYYFTVVFNSVEEKRKMLRDIGVPVGDDFVDGDILRRRLR